MRSDTYQSKIILAQLVRRGGSDRRFDPESLKLPDRIERRRTAVFEPILFG